MRALITGAGGFLGFEIARELVKRGAAVRGLSRKSYPELERLGVESVQADVRNAARVREALEGIDTVFHTAAVAGVWGPWTHFYSINTQGTENVIAGCVDQGVEKLVFTSSPSVTFDGGDQNGVDESAPYPDRWLCHYPHSKALAEQAVLGANGQGKLRTCALRPHLVWGPRDPHLVPRLLDRARQGRLVRIGNGTNWIDMVYVDNAALAHVRAADHLGPGSPVCGQAYFISQGKPVNCWQWINELLQMAGLPPLNRSISRSTAWRLGAALEWIYRWLPGDREPPMTRFLAAQLSTSHYFDISRARRDFGYEAPVSTAEGMQRLRAAWESSPA